MRSSRKNHERFYTIFVALKCTVQQNYTMKSTQEIHNDNDVVQFHETVIPITSSADVSEKNFPSPPCVTWAGIDWKHVPASMSKP